MMEDFELQQALIESRRKQYGQQAQTQAPQGRMVGNRFVAPSALEYIAAGLRGVGGMAGEAMAGDELKALSSKRQTAIADALRNFGQTAQGTPAQPEMMGNNPSAFMPAQTATPSDLPGAYAQLMQAPDAGLRKAGMQGMLQIPQLEAKKADRAEERQFRLQQLQDQHALRMEAMREQNASRQQMAEEQRNFQREMAQMRQSMGGAASQPYFQPVQTAQGVMAFNARTGKVEPVMGASGPVIGAAADPALQGALAGAKAGATTSAKAQAEAVMEAPKVVAQAEEAVKLVDDLLAAPGFKQAVGASRMLGIQKVPGTQAKDFDVRLDQLKGKQFLTAFESLKGGGAITEVEGKKATDAIARMDAASSEAEFAKAAREFQTVIRQGAERAKQKAGGAVATPAPAAPKRLRFDAQGNIIP